MPECGVGLIPECGVGLIPEWYKRLVYLPPVSPIPCPRSVRFLAPGQSDSLPPVSPIPTRLREVRIAPGLSARTRPMSSSTAMSPSAPVPAPPKNALIGVHFVASAGMLG